MAALFLCLFVIDYLVIPLHQFNQHENIMTKETRTDIQIYSAIAMLLAGVALATAGFIVPPTGEISDSVLLFFAQCLIYAGSIFGVSIYIHTKFAELKSEIDSKEEGADA
jgi:hypothetical protein